MGDERKMSVACKVVKTDASRRLIFGHLIVCKVDGEDYYDTDGTNVPEEVMLEAALDWAKSVKAADVNHEGDDIGTHPFLFPMTEEIAAAYGIKGLSKAGLMVAQQVNAETFKRFESGELTGFSVEGGGQVEFIK